MATEINGQYLNSTAERLAEKIICLQRKKGFCWATNAQLADMMNLSRGYISHELTYLERAGMIYRQVEYDERTGEVVCRKLYAFKHTQETALAKEKVEEMLKDASEGGQKRRLVANGLNVGIAPPKMIQAIMQFGIEKVDEALAVVKASNGVRNPVKYLYKALYQGWKAGKRAQSYIGTVFTGARRRVVSQAKSQAKSAKTEYLIEPMPVVDKVVLVEGGIIENLEVLKAKIRRSR